MVLPGIVVLIEEFCGLQNVVYLCGVGNGYPGKFPVGDVSIQPTVSLKEAWFQTSFFLFGILLSEL